MIPSPDAAQIRQALARFDAELRGRPAWANWEVKQNNRYAIEANGRRYPVKHILSMASGQPVHAFSGGVQGANKVLTDRGFEVVSLRPLAAEDQQPMARFREALQRILAGYRKAADESKYSGTHPVFQAFEEASRALAAFPGVVPRNMKVVPSAGKGNWASVPWISLLDPRETDTTQKGVYIVYLFRGDMSGVYATLNQGVTELRGLSSQVQVQELVHRAEGIRSRVPELESTGFALDNKIDLKSSTPLGTKYESSTIAQKFYPADDLPEPDDLAADLHALLDVYSSYVEQKVNLVTNGAALSTFTLSSAFEKLLQHIAATGFVFEPWQLAAYVTAVRTKPFVILAGVSGTGKSKLPQLVAEATGGICQRVSVRPDWTDSSDVLGCVDLRGTFRPGAVLQFARDAALAATRQHVCLLDEMNLARVEQYVAELLSGMEDRKPVSTGGFASPPLLVQSLGPDNAEWNEVGWPPNFALVGTVNMDESTHGFSRKVLDRAFTLEMSDVDLGNWTESPKDPLGADPWPVQAWFPRGQRLSDLQDLSDDERKTVGHVVTKLTEANAILAQAQVQVGYRVRDEVALFVLHARELEKWFRTQPGEPVGPLDLALHMKLLPRLVGGSGAIRRVLLQLLGWAVDGKPDRPEEDLTAHVTRWSSDRRPSTLAEAQLPRTAARLCLMWDRLQQEGFTSYWV